MRITELLKQESIGLKVLQEKHLAVPASAAALRFRMLRWRQ